MRSSMLHRATAGGINRSQCAPSTTAWIAVCHLVYIVFFFFQAEDGIRDIGVTGVQTCALPILRDETEVSDRSLVSDRYWQEMGGHQPLWPEMVRELAADPTDYERFRRRTVGTR